MDGAMMQLLTSPSSATYAACLISYMTHYFKTYFKKGRKVFFKKKINFHVFLTVDKSEKLVEVLDMTEINISYIHNLQMYTPTKLTAS